MVTCTFHNHYKHLVRSIDHSKCQHRERQAHRHLDIIVVDLVKRPQNPGLSCKTTIPHSPMHHREQQCSCHEQTCDSPQNHLECHGNQITLKMASGKKPSTLVVHSQSSVACAPVDVIYCASNLEDSGKQSKLEIVGKSTTSQAHCVCEGVGVSVVPY